MSGFNYFVKRKLVKIKQSSRKKKSSIALKSMSSEQIKLYDMVISLAIKNNTAIKFDPESDEILIVLPKMLVTLKDETVIVQNTTGFYSDRFPSLPYDMMVRVIYKEAHRERRRLKYEVKLRINQFLNKLTKTH
jgi:hypothetical protein